MFKKRLDVILDFTLWSYARSFSFLDDRSALDGLNNNVSDGFYFMHLSIFFFYRRLQATTLSLLHCEGG